MDDLHVVPELAIRAFERSTSTSVTVHDLSDAWWPFLAPDRFEHTTPQCSKIKAGFQKACTRFDVEILRREIQRFPEGCAKECHAGLVEWVVPVHENGRLRALLFAGQRMRNGELSFGLRDARVSKDAFSPSELPASIDETNSQVTLELLRQLAARLHAWHGQMEKAGMFSPELAGKKRGAFHQANLVASRGAFIRHFVLRNYARSEAGLADLAEAMGLSESRAGHAVREACGESFVVLMNEARLRRATHLLRHSQLGILEISMECGFADVSHFHRTFKRAFETTPRLYRIERMGT